METHGWSDSRQVEKIRSTAPLTPVQHEGWALEHHQHILLNTSQKGRRAGNQRLLGYELLCYRVGSKAGDCRPYLLDATACMHMRRTVTISPLYGAAHMESQAGMSGHQGGGPVGPPPPRIPSLSLIHI